MHAFGVCADSLNRTLIEPKAEPSALGRRRRHFGRHPTACASEKATTGTSSTTSSTTHTEPWKWYGTYPSLAYIANTVQLFGASIFWVSTLCGLPGLLPLSGASGGPDQVGKSEGLWIGLYWACQVIGAPCFVFAGACFCVEVQDVWWKPKPTSVGWQMCVTFVFSCCCSDAWKSCSCGNAAAFGT